MKRKIEITLDNETIEEINERASKYGRSSDKLLEMIVQNYISDIKKLDEALDYNENTTESNYMNDAVYKIVSDFAREAGIDIRYKDPDAIPEGILAIAECTGSDEEAYINMPNNDYKIRECGKEPTQVLAHEVMHCLIEGIYHEDDFQNAKNYFPLRLMWENDCDRMGIAIYLLAQMIASEEDQI